MPTLILHGGAGRIDEARHGAYERGLAAALAAGWSVLARGGEAVDAVVAAVASMEADPAAFNAGVGSSLTRDGTVECDACLMDGRDGRAGAVALVTRSASPIGLARVVMERTPHVLLAGPGADALEVDPIDPDVLVTPDARARLERWRARHGESSGSAAEPTGSATVGAVALDDAGALAAATSTGGVIGQWPGRIGDAPIPGAGTYADRSVAVSCTGKGEAFLRAVTSKALAERLAAGAALEDALARALADVNAMGGSGGLIALLADGRLAWAFDTSHMALAWRSEGAEHVSVAAEPGVTVRP
jgi:L-asparaginase / beta-aspartyl-peptidase